MKTNISISELYGRGWRTFKAKWPHALSAIIILIGIQSIFSYFGYQYDPETSVESGSILVTIVGMAVSIIFSIGVTDYFLSLSRGEDASIEQLYKAVTVKKFFSYLFAAILFGAMIVAGMILFIIPGIIVMMVFYPYYYFVVDKDVDAIESLRMARDVTKGNRWKIFFLVLTLIALNLLGLLILLVGLLVTIPLSMLIGVELYRALIGEVPTQDDESPEVEEVNEAQGELIA